MLVFRRTPRAEMAANHRRHAEKTRARVPERPPVQYANVQPALELGDTGHIHFRGHAYAVPPVPWRAGERLNQVMLAAKEFGGDMTSDEVPRYYALLAELPPLFWQLCRPVGWLPRLFRWFGWLPNPFRNATEAELGDLLGLFWARRMLSSITSSPTPGPARLT